MPYLKEYTLVNGTKNPLHVKLGGGGYSGYFKGLMAFYKIAYKPFFTTGMR